MFRETAETFGKPELVPPFLTCTDIFYIYTVYFYTQGIAIPGQNLVSEYRNKKLVYYQLSIVCSQNTERYTPEGICIP